MAHYQMTNAARFGLLDRATQVLSTAKSSFHNYRMFRNTISELEALSLRELEDLDIAPADIRKVAYEATYGSAR